MKFYEEHKGRLFAYLMRMTGDYYLSSDIMQETFMRYIEHYGNKADGVALLYTIARHILFDHARKQKHVARLEGDEEDHSTDQEHAFMVREEYRRVLDAMQALQKDERDILSLAVSGDCTYRQIAAIAGISEANVKVKVHRAREKLKDMLTNGDEK